MIDKLQDLGVEFLYREEQSDIYLKHPARDFKQTDEALRLRTSGEHTVVTYKGPKLDSSTKTRREIEIPLGGKQPAEQAIAMFTALGFTPVFTVRKSREVFQQATDAVGDVPVEYAPMVSLDTVDGLGTFVELEIMCPADSWQAGRDALLKFAEHLGLHEQERRSYLAMLMGDSDA